MTLPPETLLPSAPYKRKDQDDAQHIGTLLTEKLDSLKARCEVERIVVGPQVTRFEMVPFEGLSVRDLPKHAADLAYEVEAESVRIVAPIPGKRAVGIEIPSPNRRTVYLRDVLHAAQTPTTFAMGLDVDGKVMACNLATMPHLLVGGMTGGGKSTMIHAMLCSLLMRATPAELGLILIDPKMVEMSLYEDIPHLMRPVVIDPMEAARTLDWLVLEMECRYRFAEHYGARDLHELNDKLPEEDRFPYLICVVDELADLMMVARKEVEASVVRIAQKARAVGIHLVLATQTPRVAVVTGMIKANVPARIAFTTAQALDSRVILDQNGAESLLNRGDGLYLPSDAGKPTRFQGAFVTTKEVNDVCNWWREQPATQELEVAA
jgi:DNA segregation ATPase FtsK/SpoIIIE, S-DNA-T family